MTEELKDAVAELVAQMILDANKGHDANTLRQAVHDQIDNAFVAAYRRRFERVE